MLARGFNARIFLRAGMKSAFGLQPNRVPSFGLIALEIQP